MDSYCILLIPSDEAIRKVPSTVRLLPMLGLLRFVGPRHIRKYGDETWPTLYPYGSLMVALWYPYGSLMVALW